MTHRLEPLLNPASIALIGASDNAGRIGGLPLDLLTRFGYAGHVYPVNPKYQEVFGLRCWPDIESVPQSVDLAVLAIGAGEVTPMLRRCHAHGVRAAIVYAAGFAEAGEEGTRLQRELEEFSAASGMLVAGPNCMGFANLNTQAHTAFASVFKTAPMQQEPGIVSLLTQSGNVCAAVYALARRQGLPFSQFINTGNEACIDFSEYLEYLARDEHTEIVLGYIEQLRDGGRFVQACRELQRRGKLLIALKAGATDKGAQAVRSHTSALAGDRRVYGAAFRQLDVIEAHDFAQMAQLAYLATLRHRSAGRRVAVLTMSGALGAILADRCIVAGLELPELPAELQQVLRGGIPDYGMVGNPVDVTGNVVNDPGFVRAALGALATSEAVDAVVVYAPGYMLDRMADALAEVARAHPRLFAAIDTGAAQCRQALRDAGVAVFDDIGLAVSALAPFLLWCDARRQRNGKEPAALVEADAQAAIALPCHEAAARAHLQHFGLADTSRHARDADQAVAQADALGYPVALKIVSADLPHKTEAGGVALQLGDADAVRNAYDRVVAAAARHAPRARLDGVLVQRMERGVAELIVGATRDPVFGPVLTVGLGGVLTELYQDTAHRLLPIDAAEAEAMLRELKVFPLLDGYRGKPKADLAAACRAMVAVGQALLATPQAAEIEVNPLLVKEAGQGVAVLDALILPISQSFIDP
ncbi:acetate--CoA ligase family protein [Bordetella genomosp. 7]|uniref:CoA-binding protein n=1 Tax=Bordetella genomosp. 7 TaxID=1416805 RepID=A0A261QYD8_9BORD|nr:acetate--CoA ligase family protein [Bordetella genomosp. 7]OZI17774.1 CoA-binding protein [Bordetella genomosp. 7]